MWAFKPWWVARWSLRLEKSADGGDVVILIWDISGKDGRTDFWRWKRWGCKLQTINRTPSIYIWSNSIYLLIWSRRFFIFINLGVFNADGCCFWLRQDHHSPCEGHFFQPEEKKFGAKRFTLGFFVEFEQSQSLHSGKLSWKPQVFPEKKLSFKTRIHVKFQGCRYGGGFKALWFFWTEL